MRCLVADPDPGVHIFLLQHLPKPGACDTAVGGSEALSRFRVALESGVPYGAVFMGMRMPGMDGHELSARMRGMEKDRGVSGPQCFKLILMAGAGDAREATRAFFRGFADGCLKKPLDPEAVRAGLGQAGIV